MRNGEVLTAYWGLFWSCPVINCSVFTLHALLNSNICLDGILPVCCDCLRRTALAVIVQDIYEQKSQ